MRGDSRAFGAVVLWVEFLSAANVGVILGSHCQNG